MNTKASPVNMSESSIEDQHLIQKNVVILNEKSRRVQDSKVEDSCSSREQENRHGFPDRSEIPVEDGCVNEGYARREVNKTSSLSPENGDCAYFLSIMHVVYRY